MTEIIREDILRVDWSSALVHRSAVIVRISSKGQCVITLRGNRRFYAPFNSKSVQTIRKILDDPCVPDLLRSPDRRSDAWNNEEVVLDGDQRV